MMLRPAPYVLLTILVSLCWPLLWLCPATLAVAPVHITMILWNGMTPNEVGFQEGLREVGYNIDFDIVDVQGNMQTLQRILQQPQRFAPAQLLYVATAPVLQAVLDTVPHIPIIFRIDSHAATHDIGIVLKQSHSQITGICNNVQFALQQRAMQQILPIERLGFIYDPGNADAIAERQYLRQMAMQD